MPPQRHPEVDVGWPDGIEYNRAVGTPRQTKDFCLSSRVVRWQNQTRTLTHHQPSPRARRKHPVQLHSRAACRANHRHHFLNGRRCLRGSHVRWKRARLCQFRRSLLTHGLGGVGSAEKILPGYSRDLRFDANRVVAIWAYASGPGR